MHSHLHYHRCKSSSSHYESPNQPVLRQVTSFNYPNPAPHSAGTSEASPTTGEAGAAAEGGHKLRILR